MHRSREARPKRLRCIRLARGAGLALVLAATASHASDDGLDAMLGAGDEHAFSELLARHGPVREAELPALVEAAGAWLRPGRRRNAARALLLVRGDPKRVRRAQIEVARDTGDVAVWAVLGAGLLDTPGEDARVALDRPKLIRAALDFTDDDSTFAGHVQSTGLRAGVWAHTPGIDAELKKRLDQGDPEVSVVALEALPPEMAASESARLLKMLAAYEAAPGTHQHPEGLFVALERALFRSADAHEQAVAHDALSKGFVTIGTTNGARRELLPFRNAAVSRVDPGVNRFCWSLISQHDPMASLAFDILTTQVWTGQTAPTTRLVKQCVAVLDERAHTADRVEESDCGYAFALLSLGEDLEAARRDSRYAARLAKLGAHWRQDCADQAAERACSGLLYYIETGANPIGRSGPGSPKPKSTPLAFGQVWLSACAEKKDCAP